MCKKFLIVVFLGLSTTVMAERSDLKLQCSLSVNHYHQMEDSFQVKTVTLSGLKHLPTGAAKVFELPDYDFWVMTHTVQNIETQAHINNFQVALHNKHSGNFVHALSNTVFPNSADQMKARISLVDYYSDTLSEEGELLFECQTPME